MIIKPNASPDEQDSPFYKTNEEFCSKFERFITAKNGKVKGSYNAWSYLIFGKIIKPKNWTLKYKKATFTSGNLWITAKHQNLLVLAEWTTEIVGKPNSEFLIRRRTRTDFIKKIVNKSLSKFNIYEKYIIESEKNQSQLTSKLVNILDSLFKLDEIYTIDYRNDKLKIELRTEKYYFEIFDKLTTEL